MLLGEPQSTPYDLNFQIGSVPVRVHPLFWLMSLIMGFQSGDAISVVIWIGVVFLSILIHELGHAVAMRLYGEFPRIVLYMMGGLAISDGGYVRGRFSAGQRGRRGAWQQIVISAAGPGAGFLLAGIVIALTIAGSWHVSFHRPTLEDPFFWRVVPDLARAATKDPDRLLMLVNYLLFINILWGCVNLLPIHPLDGGQIARQFMSIWNPTDAVRNSLYLSIGAAVVMSFVAFTAWHQTYTGVFFAYLAAMSYLSLRSPW